MDKIAQSLDTLDDVISGYEDAISVRTMKQSLSQHEEDPDDLYDDAVSLATAVSDLSQSEKSNTEGHSAGSRSFSNTEFESERYYDQAYSLGKPAACEGHSPRSKSPRQLDDEDDESLYDDAFSAGVFDGEFSLS